MKSRIKVGDCHVKNIQMKYWGKEGTTIEAVDGKRRKAPLCTVNKFTITQNVVKKYAQTGRGVFNPMRWMIGSP